jgi:hypothetical protein
MKISRKDAKSAKLFSFGSAQDKPWRLSVLCVSYLQERQRIQMWCKLVALLIAFGLFFSLGATQDDKSYHASSFNVDIVAQHDGSLDVRETVTFNFAGGPFTFVFRELPTDHTDGITTITAGVDGTVWPEGTAAGQVEISGRDPILITWHLPPTNNTTQTFNLNYRVLGVARQTEEADLLLWQALPDEYDYTIYNSRITLSFPADAELLGTPEVTAGSAEVTVEGNQVVATMQDLEENDPLVLQLRFSPGSLISTPPNWQVQQTAQAAQQSRFAWVWVALSALIVIGGILAIVTRVTRTRSGARAAPKVTGIAYEPPDDLPPAMAGLLHTSNGRAGWQHALGTLFDLAGRGILIIEEQPKEAWYQSRDWVIKQVNPGRDLRPHEEQLLEMLFTSKSGEWQESVKMSQLHHLLSSSRWKWYTESLEAEMKAAGLLDAEQLQRGRQLVIAGVMMLMTAALGFILVFLFSRFFGFWPLLPVGALLVISLIAIIAGYGLSPLTPAAMVPAAQWESFHRYLKDVTKRKAAVSSPDMFERYLPHAAAIGLLATWANHFKKEEQAQPPAYFHALNMADNASYMGAFVAMTAASSSSGGAAAGAGAAGAGAAGGGASGAG